MTGNCSNQPFVIFGQNVGCWTGCRAGPFPTGSMTEAPQTVVACSPAHEAGAATRTGPPRFESWR
jgi:hypothetical protein